MAVEIDSPFQIIRKVVQKFLGEMRVVRSNTEEQAKAKAEEIKSNSLAPGKSQYSVSEVDNIVKEFKKNYVNLLRNLHLLIVTESTTKIRQAVEQGFVNGGLITEEMLDQLGMYKERAERLPELEKKLKEQTTRNSEIEKEFANLKSESKNLKTTVAEMEAILQEKDAKITELVERTSTVEIDSSVVEERDELLKEKERTIHKLNLEKNNIQSELSRVKIDRDSLASQVKELQTKVSSIRAEAVSKEDQLFEDLQKQLNKSRSTVFNLRNQLAEKEDTVRNQKIDIQTKSSQIESLKQQNDQYKKEIEEYMDITNRLKNELKLLKQKLEKVEVSSAERAELTEEETRLKEIIEEKEREIVTLQSQIDTYRTQNENMKIELNDRDTDMERLAESMIEFQQEISGKQQELHSLKSQLDEIMLELAEKEAVIKELSDFKDGHQGEKQIYEEKLAEKEQEFAKLREEYDLRCKELETAKNTVDMMEKQGTMSSEEKYAYELKVQKLKRNIDYLKKTIKSVESFLNTDPKYRILYLLSDFNRPLSFEEIQNILKIENEVLSKYLFELDYFGYVKKSIEGTKTMIINTSLLTPPLSYEEEEQ